MVLIAWDNIWEQNDKYPTINSPIFGLELGENI
jgi:hypothetical protein